MIFTHSRDHFGGKDRSEKDVKSGKVNIAPEEFRHAISENVFAGTAE